MREWTDELWKILTVGVPAVWEANGRSGKIPRTTLFMSGNLPREEVDKRLKPAVRSKLALFHTGEKSLAHENLTELCVELLGAAKKLHEVLPSVIGLGEPGYF